VEEVVTNSIVKAVEQKSGADFDYKGAPFSTVKEKSLTQ
jgi:hypothetical protein